MPECDRIGAYQDFIYNEPENLLAPSDVQCIGSRPEFASKTREALTHAIVTAAGHSRPGDQQYAPVICWPRSRPQLNRSARPQGPHQEMTTIGDAMLTFECAPKSRTPKFSSS
jgi:hypothetical protein